MSVSSQEFRDVLRHFASGVTIVTASAGGERRGMTVSAFSSVSSEPPLVAVVIDQAHSINPFLAGDNVCFAVNILAADQQELSDRFAFTTEEDRFLAGDWTTASTGAPVLANAVAWLDCRLAGAHPAGTHTIYLGSVVAAAVPRPDIEPLVYWNRGYRRLESEPGT